MWALQGGADPFVGDRATAQGEDARFGLAQQLECDPLLGLPECGFAVLGEHALDRLAQPLLHDRVDVDRLRAERLRQAAGSGRLAGAHEADAGYGRRHAIRSS